MLIEYRIKFGADGVTVSQSVDHESSAQPDAAIGSPTANGLPAAHPGSSGGAGNPRTGTGGAGNPRTGTGGAGNPRTGTGGAGNPHTGTGGGNALPPIVFGPIIIGSTNGNGQTSQSGEIAQFQMQPQKEINWCWAAVAVSVDHYFSPQSTSTQCRLAGKLFNLPNCCRGALQCDQPTFLENALGELGRTPDIQPPLNFDAVREQIDQHHPVCVRIGWPEQQRGHFVVISGYRLLPSGEALLEIADPFYGSSIMDFDAFTSSYQGSGVWTNSYLVS